MAISFKIGVCNLLSEFFTDALVFGGFGQSAGTVSAFVFKPFANRLYDLFILIQPYSHGINSFIFIMFLFYHIIIFFSISAGTIIPRNFKLK